MKTKDFYLIDSLDISGLDESQKAILDDYLTTYHDSSSVVDKAVAIDALVGNGNFANLREKYTTWLFKYVTSQLKTATIEEEIQFLRKILGNCHHSFGIVQYYRGDYALSLEGFQKSLKIREEINDKEGLSYTCRTIAMMYREQGNTSTALQYYEKSISLSREIGNTSILAKSYLGIMIILRNQGNYSKAHEYLYKATKIYEDNNDEEGMILSYHNIGCSLLEQNEIEAALKYFFKGLKLAQKIGHKESEANLYTQIGEVHEKKKKNDIALEYYNKAIKIQPNKKFLAESYFNMGILYENQEQYELALKHYYNSLQWSEKIGEKEGIVYALSKIGPLEIQRGNMDEAHQQIHRVFTLAKKLDNPLLIKEATTAKVSLAVAKGDYKLAYEMETLKTEMKDKIQNEHNQKEIIKQQFEYEHEKELLKKDIEIEFEKKNADMIQQQSDILALKNEELASKNEIINQQVTEMNLLIRKLQESNESLNQFAAVAAHDLKAPLRNIQGFSQILHRKYADKFPQKDMELFEFITGSCLSLKDLIDGLLNYSKISNMKYQAQCVDLAEIVSSVKSNLSNIIKETEVVLHISDNLPKVFGQESLLFQVFLNFINNAIKFRRTDAGLQSAIWINSEYHDDDFIKISIKDNGIGIEEKYQNTIFGIFKKLHSSDEYEGSGIGLSVCKKIIERFGGEVGLESQKGLGTTFFFTLKLYDNVPEKQLVGNL